MNKIRKLSQAIQALLAVYGTYLVTSLFFPWLFLGSDLMQKLNTSGHFQFRLDVKSPTGLIDIAQTALPFNLTLWGMFSHLIAIIPFILGVYILFKLFARYAKGEIFTPQNAACYQYCGILFFLNELVTRPISEMIRSYIGGIVSGYDQVFTSMNGPNFSLLMMGTMMIIIAYVMEEGLRILEEHRLTI